MIQQSFNSKETFKVKETEKAQLGFSRILSCERGKGEQKAHVGTDEAKSLENLGMAESDPQVHQATEGREGGRMQREETA